MKKKDKIILLIGIFSVFVLMPLLAVFSILDYNKKVSEKEIAGSFVKYVNVGRDVSILYFINSNDNLDSVTIKSFQVFARNNHLELGDSLYKETGGHYLKVYKARADSHIYCCQLDLY